MSLNLAPSSMLQIFSRKINQQIHRHYLEILPLSKNSPSQKHLGMILYMLNFSDNIALIIEKAHKRMSVLLKFRKYLQRELFAAIFRSYVQHILTISDVT